MLNVRKDVNYKHYAIEEGFKAFIAYRIMTKVFTGLEGISFIFFKYYTKVFLKFCSW